VTSDISMADCYLYEQAAAFQHALRITLTRKEQKVEALAWFES